MTGYEGRCEHCGRDIGSGHTATCPYGKTAPAVEQVTQRLERVTENLHGYLAQRADELARPLIAAARAAADEQTRVAQHGQQRAEDLLDETRRHWKAALRRAHRAEHHLGAIHPAGECGDCDARRTDAADLLTTPTTEETHR